MNYLVYKITNQTNDKIYIGVHKTSNVDDGYMGSGVMIKRAIKKYGLENFKKEILAQFESADEMFNEEKNLISQLSPEYNLHPGGNGGFEYINENKLGVSIENQNFDRKVTAKIASEKLKELELIDPGRKIRRYKKASQSLKGKQAFLGKSHSEETKRKIGVANSKHQLGDKNSNYGKCWITDGVLSKMIYRTEPIPTNWRPGRVI